MTQPTDKRLRILCLHGFRQSKKTFRQKTGSLRKILKNKAELVYMTAPNLVPTDEKSTADEQYGWWFSKSDETYSAKEYSDCCKGYEEAIIKVEKFMEQNGPFDGILAFSQGASFLSLICGLKEKSGGSRYPFRFVILIAGFISRQSQHTCLYENIFNIPSLHVIGETDQVIPRDMSDELLPKFSNPDVLRHPGGHFVPTSGPQKAVYIEFLNKFIQDP